MKKYIATPEVSLNSNLKVDLYYSKWSWVFLSVRTVEIEYHDGYKTESYMMFGNPKDRIWLVKPMQRYSAKVVSHVMEKFEDTTEVDWISYYHKDWVTNTIARIIEEINK